MKQTSKELATFPQKVERLEKILGNPRRKIRTCKVFTKAKNSLN
jgi:hypothetical protein